MLIHQYLKSVHQGDSTGVKKMSSYQMKRNTGQGDTIYREQAPEVTTEAKTPRGGNVGLSYN